MRTHTDSFSALNQNLVYRIIENQRDARVLQMLLHFGINLIADLGAQMPDRAFDQLQIGVNRLRTDLPDFLLLVHAPDICRRAELQINIVRFTDQFRRFVISQNFRKRSADIGRKRKLSVGKRAGARKTGCNRARFAVHALACLALRTFSALN